MANKRKISAAVLFSLLATCAFAQTATTDPVGFVRKECSTGFTGLAAPLLASPLYTGRVLSNSAGSVVFEGSGLAIGDLISSAGPCYLEVLDGALEGERVDLDEITTIAANDASVGLDLTVAYNTLAPTSDVLIGSLCVLRSHVTLGELGQMFSPALVGNNNVNLADRLHVFDGGSWVRYYLRGDGVTWRRAASSTPYTDMVIAPGTGVLVELVSSAKEIVQTGAVRMNAFRMNLAQGTQCVASPYPISMTPVEFGAFVDANVAANSRWVGANNPALADTISPFEGGSFVRYNLRSDGATWRVAGSTEDYSDDQVLVYDGPSLIKRTNADSAYLVLRPFAE